MKGALFRAAAAAMLALAVACASFDGRGLVPGRSSGAEVEALMGRPAQRLERPDGTKLLYFSRQPAGRAMYVATLGPDGVLRSLEQRLVREQFEKIVAGAWTRDQVSELLDPPWMTGYFPRQKREWWEYKFAELSDKRVLWVQFSDDGVVREVMNMPDPEEVRPGGTT